MKKVARQTKPRRGTGKELLQAVQDYCQRGWKPVPVPLGKKAPRIKDWARLRLTESDLAKSFRSSSNVGLLLGEPSGGLVDVDLDSPQAARVGPALLPPTDRIHRRPNGLGVHRWYTADPIPQPESFNDPNGACLVALRSTGQQTLVPPSTHPAGEMFYWERNGTPAQVDGAELRRGVARVAACSLLARNWPRQGRVRPVIRALAGVLLSSGWRDTDVTQFISTAAHAASNTLSLEFIQGQVEEVDLETLQNGSAPWIPQLVEILTQDIVHKMQDWLEINGDTAKPNDQASTAWPYGINSGRLTYVRDTNDGPVVVPLCNFVARIREELLLDDGVETKREFVVDGKLDSGELLPRTRVPATQFGGLLWVAESWGARAVVCAGYARKDQLREAIQKFSPDARRRRIYTHTGWCQVNREWVYLTANGGVGRDEFEVQLTPELARYWLPRVSENPRDAMRASLQLLHLAPLTVTAPLWGSAYRAPLLAVSPCDLLPWLEGPTGALKSSLAALFLAHYGEFDRTHLPGAWASTVNHLERRAFVLKDVLFVVDDYVPTASNAREMETKAQRLLRSVGNQAGRGRLRSDLTEAPTYPPRSLIIATGEQHPSGQSTLARMLLIEIERDFVDLEKLTAAQRMASHLPHAMAGYVAWLAPQMVNLAGLLRETFEGTQAKARVGAEHLRVPEALAHMWLGIHCGLNFAEEIGACSHGEGEDLRAQCWDALLKLGSAQGHLVEQERPTRRFLRVLLALVTQRQAFVLPRQESEERMQGVPGFIGWYDNESLYLIPEIAFTVVAKSCRDSGELFPISSDRLKRDLSREGLSVCDEGRHTTTARVGRRVRRVLCLRRCAIETLLGEDFPVPSASVTTVTGSEG